MPSSEDRSFSSSCYQHFQCMIAFFVTKTNSWLTVNFVYKRTPPCPLQLSSPPASQLSACTGTWGYSFPSAGLLNLSLLHWNSPVCWGPTGWQHFSIFPSPQKNTSKQGSLAYSSPESFFLTFPKTGVTPAFLLYSDSSSNHLVQPKTESELTMMSGIFYSTSKCISSGPITTCPVCLSNL